jgi:pimeloyl-ACP methyl ester carboxylesterase
MRPWTQELAGRIEVRELTSPALGGNPLGDPATRPLLVYLPPGYDGSALCYPVVYVLQGFASFVTRWSQRGPFDLTAPELIDAAFAAGTPPCLVVYVDGWTRFGGSQFLDSPGTGQYRTYLCEDVVGFVDAEYRTIPRGARRAVVGHSSGGYGAIVTAMARPDLFSAFGSLAGDCCFELSLLPDLARAHRALRDHYDGSYDRFFADFATRGLSGPGDFSLILIWALAACYSAEPDGSVSLPFDPGSGELVAQVWARWLALDPVRMVAGHAAALRGLRGIWIDAGRHDDYFLDVAAGILVAELGRAGVDDVAFELYDGSHRHDVHRYPPAVDYLARRITLDA